MDAVDTATPHKMSAVYAERPASAIDTGVVSAGVPGRFRATVMGFGATPPHLMTLSGPSYPCNHPSEMQPCPSVNQPLSEAARRSGMAKGSAGKILVVEDDDGMREAVESLLNAAGFEVGTYRSAEEFFANDAIDKALCVITDIRLPAMSGLALLTTVRALDAAPPVIVITAHDSPGFRVEAERRGAAAFLGKPFQGGALLASIERVLKKG
jgi:CheY-like chemotaxis protein